MVTQQVYTQHCCGLQYAGVLIHVHCMKTWVYLTMTVSSSRNDHCRHLAWKWPKAGDSGTAHSKISEKSE